MGRPPKTSAAQILDAATLIDPGSLQLTKVAADLGISVSTVYYYFPTRESLLDALTSREVELLGLPDFTTAAHWRDVLAELAAWHYKIGSTQPGWFFGNAGQRGLVIQAIQILIARLADLGWTQHDALMSATIVGNWAVAAGEAARRTSDAGGLEAAVINSTLDGFLPGEQREQLAHTFAGMSLEAVYDTGLAATLAGVSMVIASALDD